MTEVSAGLEATVAGPGATMADAGVGVDEGMPERIGRFAVRRKLGAGGMGAVFEGYDAELDRRIAIKVVGRSSASGRERLLREAQAMARVSHANVLPVYEVGAYRRGIYIAMELVDGETLGEWLARVQPGQAEILDAFRRAGFGLAAAHRAGLVHRDFKPDNVMVGKDGRVRVMDFGLVRGTAPDGEHHVPAPSETADDPDDPSDAAGDGRAASGEMGEPGRSAGSLSATLTNASSFLGTPAYMSPEQFLRAPADARTDQFSYCVALYEALYGERPFRGKTFVALGRAVTEGEIAAPPADAAVPGWIRAALLRGLAREPADRWPSMDALLDRLADDPRVRRRRWFTAGGIGAAFVALGVLAVLPRGEAGPTCDDGAAEVSATWGAEQREALESAFAGDRPGYVAQSVALASATLDDYARRWAVASDQLCVRFHHEHASSDEAFDLQRSCLDRARASLGLVAAELGRGDEGAVEHVDALLETLPDLDRCGDVERLRAVAPPDEDVADEVARLRSELGGLEVQRAAGRFEGLVEGLYALRARAEATGYAHVVAEVALAQAGVPDDFAPASQRWAHASAALEAAVRAGDAHLETSALIELAATPSGASPQLDQEMRERWLAVADAHIERLGRPPRQEINWLVTAATLRRDMTDSAERLSLLERARALIETEYPSPSVQMGAIEAELAWAQVNAGHVEASNDALSRARAEYDATVGATHPRMGDVYMAAARAAATRGEWKRNRELLRRAQAIYVEAYGPASPTVLRTLETLSVSYDLDGHKQEARDLLERVLELRGESDAATTMGGLQNLNSLCFIELKLGELDAAKRHCDQAVDAMDSVLPKGHAFRAIILNNVALIARAEGRHRDALALDLKALDIAEGTLGEKHPMTAYSYVGVGESLLALGRVDEAAAVLRKALAARPAESVEPGERGEAQCLLARAVAGVQPAQARALATEGLAELDAAGSNWVPQARACRAFLGDP